MNASGRRTTTIELRREDMKFSAGHFTVFSATERERLHGHDFGVSVAVTADVDDNGLAFDYGVYKDLVRKLCRDWNEVFLLPAMSPHVRLHEEGEYVIAVHAGERLPFLRRDVLILPVRNVTLEDLSELFLQRILQELPKGHGEIVSGLLVKVLSGPGQSASATWSRRE
jgi:6-pyruvoyltetrahydropterin/6-carboxytetrahydropterin synthase